MSRPSKPDWIDIDADSDIEIVPNIPPKTGEESCALCSMNFQNMTINEKQRHYDVEHADGPSDSSKERSGATSSMGSSSKNIVNWKRKDKENWAPFWHSGMSNSPPEIYTPGLMTVLKKLLMKSQGQSTGKTVRAVLCREDVVHIRRESLDRTWGCGYRNFMMVCTALLTQTKQSQYAELFLGHPQPGVRGLQEWIENAWAHGFDEEGAGQLTRLLRTSKWVGVADIWVAFSYIGIPSNLVDFRLAKCHKKDRPKKIMDWVVKYFTPEKDSSATNAFQRIQTTVVATDKMPLILQWKGHSTMIVGYEILRDGTTQMLTFDSFIKVDSSTRMEARRIFDASHGRASSSTIPTEARPTLKTFLQHHSPMKKAKKRRQFSDDTSPCPKRPRAETEDPQEIIVISDTEEELPKTPTTSSASPSSTTCVTSAFFDPEKSLKEFRVTHPALKQQENFQILYFPLDPPLTWVQQQQFKTCIPTAVIQ